MNRIALTLALAAGIACAAFGYEPQRHNDTFTTNGITYAQRGGLGASDYVVTNIDASAVGKVKSVNTKTGDVVLDAQDVGAVAKDFVANPFDPTKDYAEGDVVQIDGKFYVFITYWRHQWSGSPIENECVEELKNIGGVTKYQNAQDFLQLGYGGTNAPSYKKIHTGINNGHHCYFTLEPDGFSIDGSYGERMRVINDEFRITTNNWESYWSIRLRNTLTKDSVLPMRNDYFSENYKYNATSPWHIYSYLTNNYLTKASVEYNYLTKTEAGNTYMTETAADGKYSTPAGVASAIATALGDFKTQYIYNSDGNERMDVDGKVKRQTHNGWNVNFIGTDNQYSLMWNGQNQWYGAGTPLGDIHIVRENGVVSCTEYPIVRYSERYTGDTVWHLAPLGTFRAVTNSYGSLSWVDYKQVAYTDDVVEKTDFNTATNSLQTAIKGVEATVPNNITRTGTDATLVHCDSGNCTNALVYIRQATSSLAGLMTAADKSAFDTMKQTVSNHETAIQTVTNDNAQTRQIVTTWENFLDGSNVVFSITNYLSGTYSLDAAKMTIKELREGEYREVYNSRDEILLHIQDFKDNDFKNATNQVIGAVNAAIGNKADRDWGKYTSAGGEAPENTVYMTAPNTVFAGGLEYERVAVGEGTICVLTTHGAPVWTQGDEGTFKFQDDGGTNYFGFAKTDSYTIGANTDGITVQSGMVTINYNITMSGRPCVWYKANLTSNTPWEQLNLPDGSPVAGASHAVTWEQNPPAGTQVCYINVGNQPQGFFRATVEVAGEAKFMTNMPADLSGGIICPNTATGVNGVIKPTFNGTTVQWTWSAQ